MGVGPFQGVDGVLASYGVVEVPLDPIGFLEPLVGVAVVVNAAIFLANLLSKNNELEKVKFQGF